MEMRISKYHLRWHSVTNVLERLNTINLNFSDFHKSHCIAYKFIGKSVISVLHNGELPDLQKICSPKTKYFIKACQRKHKLNKIETSQDKIM